VAFCKKNSHAIIEGFPKTLSQAIAFQKKGSYPDKIIFVNVDKDKLFELCLKKLKAHGQGRPE
jgi:adenylate kinase family enzyme